MTNIDSREALRAAVEAALSRFHDLNVWALPADSVPGAFSGETIARAAHLAEHFVRYPTFSSRNGVLAEALGKFVLRCIARDLGLDADDLASRVRARNASTPAERRKLASAVLELVKALAQPNIHSVAAALVNVFEPVDPRPWASAEDRLFDALVNP